MEFADIIINRIEGENDPKKPINALICFSREETGKALGILVDKLIRNKPGKSSITFLNLIDKAQANKIEDENTYKSQLFSDLIKLAEADRITVRTFVKQSENFTEDILQTFDEFNCNILLMGVGQNIFNPSLWSKYQKIREDITSSIAGSSQELDERTSRSLQNISSLLNRNEQVTAIFITNNFVDAKKIFVPILKETDIIILPYLYQISKNSDTSITLWDTAGYITLNPKLQRLYQSISRKSDGKIKLWDNNKKIGDDFVSQQDLVLIGFDGWEKLLSTPLPWIHNLPSVLIIKDKKTSL